jgi:DNA polymerase I-like protein with 3'-5' exonuclease and polymerase domains
MIIPQRELKPLVLNPPLNVVKVLDADGVKKLREFLENNQEFGFDIETTVTDDFYWRRIRTIQFGNTDIQYVIDLKKFCSNSADLLYDCQGEYGAKIHLAPELQQLLDVIQPYLKTDKFIKIGVNESFEYMCLYWNLGIRAFGFYDCLLAEKCIYAGLGGKASLKNYGFYSMESMAERYFGVMIDKTLQTSFNLDNELSEEQFYYAALDTRLPLAIKKLQDVISSGETIESLVAKKLNTIATQLKHLDPLIFGDNLKEVIQIENNALGAFTDMHLHGERLDTERWLKRVQKSKDALVLCLSKLDEIFLPIVGSKNEAVDEEYINSLEVKWKGLRIPADDEINLNLKLKVLKKELRVNTEVQPQVAEVVGQLSQLETLRLEQKEKIKAEHSDLKKKRTKINNLKADCEGEALINYGSNSQLLSSLRENFKVLSKLEKLDDDILKEYESIPVMKLIREYHGLQKEIGTYGDAWTQQWKTHPCKEEGWLSPGDGRLHCEFNQYDAETGRSSSSKPNAQNLPQDKEVRGCFIADPPDEKYPDGYKLITIDMSGAELRILAEEANDTIWINAFNKNEDVHSVCTELVEGEHWKQIAEPGCAYFKLNDLGEPAHKKCKCAAHNELRNGMKPTNFGLPYGIGPVSLAAQIGKSVKETKLLMEKHKQAFPNIWTYLEKSGQEAKLKNKSFDMFGRRRILPTPTQERAVENCKEYNEKNLRLSEAESEKNISAFITACGRKPTNSEEFDLTHRKPNVNEISKSYHQMMGGLERKGKNHRIQSTNASIAKVFIGSGYDLNGKPFLWHILPEYDAKLLKFVHDEVVIQVPKIYAEIVAKETEDAIRRAGALKFKYITMESEYRIGDYWEK